MGISKRLWDVARSRASGFASAFSLDQDVSESRSLESDVAEAGRRTRQATNEDVGEFERDKAQGGIDSRPGRGEIEGWYRTLELDAGAGMGTVRKSYRRLLAKYHPDKYASDPDKYSAATEVTRQITTAYNGLKNLNG
ncbi:MAG: J domain-containing protein [Myxococcales bacterium]|nr:J domain-containing protein [Myxococcales bacterium]